MLGEGADPSQEALQTQDQAGVTPNEKAETEGETAPAGILEAQGEKEKRTIEIKLSEDDLEALTLVLASAENRLIQTSSQFKNNEVAQENDRKAHELIASIRAQVRQ